MGFLKLISFNILHPSAADAGDKDKDQLFGGDGDDELEGDSEDDVVDGGAGNNKIKVGKPEPKGGKPKPKGGKK